MELNADERRRFWSKVRKGRGCWEWQAGGDKNGYGVFWLNRMNRKAHRVSWTINVDQIPEGLCVLHRCDNPPCVRPSHLWLGSPADNTRDMIEKERDTLVGKRSAARKLSDDQVRGIRKSLLHGFRQVDIADRYGTTQGHVSRISRGVTRT